MMKLPSLAVTVAAGVLLLAHVPAQRAPLPGMPMLPPPAGHTGLLAQPLAGDQQDPAPATASSGPARPKADPATRGVKVVGKDLKKAVAKVKALDWHKRLDDALDEARETGKPVLWLLTLGDLSGFA